ncbi:putative bifunctional diguanylate cyclase/phosphodiesterase [Paractinoplanes hotanensis]|uniref:EAL domain-containing protein n=1 Tax=Paractinoplanes hotanensis TaxID=2906497 RepID=A0ABT0Y4E7_9ACTN|nr:EAL domain-containing protein [Actinoplanes hotanensis]MCM4080918.1 EAL domain-containing protein [Actinoplanes hotanensis]
MPLPRLDDHGVDYWTRQIRVGALIATLVTLLGALQVVFVWAPERRWWAIPVAAAALAQAVLAALPWRRWVRHPRVRSGLFVWWVLEIPTLAFLAYFDPNGVVYYLPCAMLIVILATALYPASAVAGLGVLAVAGFFALLPGHPGTSSVLVAGLLSVMGCVVLITVIIAHNRRRLDDRRRVAERRSEALLQNSPEVVVAIGRNDKVRYATPSMRTVLGHTPESVTGTLLITLTHPDDRPQLRGWMATLRSSPPGTVAEIETRLRRADGSWALLDAIGTNCLHDPDLEAIVLSVRDVGPRKALEQQLSRQAFCDPLTGLSNRALFRDRLEHATARRDADVTVLLVDLDDFKSVNDNLGHSAGDELLTALAARLRDNVRPGDTLARLGGDEFAVLIEDLDGRDPGALAERLLHELRKPISVAGHEIRRTASIGVAAGGESGEELLRNADLAMYAAKRQGRNAYALFDPEMYASLVNEAQLRAEMETALTGQQFVVHYQPVVDLPTQRLTGVEALVRWQHPERGLLAPQHFIDTAEESGLIVPLGRWVLRESLRQLARWQRPGFKMNVNLSARQFQDPALVTDVRDTLAESGVDPACLTLEITESMLLQDIDAATDTLHALRRLGVRLAIDDFGTGYSSLNYLKRLPVDIIKIDRAFVTQVATDDGDKALVDAVVGLSQALRMQTVAEGIETDDQWTALRRLGCDFGQGFLFGRPVDPASIELLLDEPLPAA